MPRPRWPSPKVEPAQEPSKRELQTGAKPAKDALSSAQNRITAAPRVLQAYFPSIAMPQRPENATEATAGVECGDPELGPQQVRNVPSPTMALARGGADTGALEEGAATRS